MNLFNDPMAAAFIPLVLLLVLGLAMYFTLAQEENDHGWWIHTLQALHLVPKPPEPDVPLATKTNVLYIGPDRPPPTPEPAEVVDYHAVIERSCSFFKWLTVVMLVLTAIHGFRFYRRANPYFLWGPKPVVFANPAQRGSLPSRATGAGGAGAAPVGAAGVRPPGPTGPTGTPGSPGLANPAAPQPGSPGGVPLPPPGGGAGLPGSH